MKAAKSADKREKSIAKRALRRLVIADCFRNLRFFEEMYTVACKQADEAHSEAAHAMWHDSEDYCGGDLPDDIYDGTQHVWHEAWSAFWLEIGFAGEEQPDLEASDCGVQRALATATDDLIDQMMAGRSSGCLGQIEQASLDVRPAGDPTEA